MGADAAHAKHATRHRGGLTRRRRSSHAPTPKRHSRTKECDAISNVSLFIHGYSEISSTELDL